MVYRFRLVSDEVDDFKREIEIDADDNFLKLGKAICDAVGYDLPPMCSFFTCDSGWEKDREITLEDMGADSSQDVRLMDETIISDLIEDEGQRLIFVFDYITDRAFFIELKQSRPGEYLDAPKTVSSVGEAPAQHVDLDDFESQIDAKITKAAETSDFDADLDFDTESFDDEDIANLGSYDPDDLV